MRLLVTGKQGQVVQALLKRCAETGIEIHTIGRPELDMSNAKQAFETMRAAITAVQPSLIVNAAAYTAVDQAEDEPELAFANNAASAGEIARAAFEANLPIIQISTDYVFDGTKDSPYSETDAPNPQGVYGASKLAGEQAVAAANPQHLILRTAWVYSPFGKNFVKTMLRLAETRDDISVVGDQFGNPTSAYDIANGILAAARRIEADPATVAWGIYHLSGTGATHWAGFAEEIFRLSATRDGPVATVKHITSAEYPTKAKRPANSQLDCTAFEQAFWWKARNWQAGLAETLEALTQKKAEAHPAKPETIIPPKRICILVLGMHRSGTSALTRVLGLMGAALPKNMLGPSESNEPGHWEPERLINLHDQMLAEAGNRWDDWRRLDLEKQLPPGRLEHYKSEIRHLIDHEYGEAPLFVLKEPRICRFVTLYCDVLTEMGIAVRPVIALRHPLEVAASLAARNKIAPMQSQLYWLRHVIDAERDSRNLPRSLVDYDALLSDWRKAIMPLESTLGVRWPHKIENVAVEIDGFLTSTQRHHTADEMPENHASGISGWVRRAYTALKIIKSDTSAAVAELDAVGREFEAGPDLFGALLAAEREKYDAARAEIESLRGELTVERQQSAERAARVLAAQEVKSASQARNAKELIERQQHQFDHVQARLETMLASKRWRLATGLADFYYRLPPLIRTRAEKWFKSETRWKHLSAWLSIRFSGLFDTKYYFSNNPDVKNANQNAITHYLRYGAAEGRNPSENFQTQFYVTRYPDVARSNQNPLLHFIRYGRHEGRYATHTQAGEAENTPSESLQSVFECWGEIQPAQLADVSVVIPVYNGRKHLERLLPSLERHTSLSAEIIFVDDASTDEAIVPLIEAFRQRVPHSTRLLRSVENSGFVHSVNIGADAARRHFVLLNTDTEVPAHWLERLMAPILSDPHIASATPFSNAATIFSFPVPNVDNLLPARLSGSQIDDVFNQFTKTKRLDIEKLDVPTGVGFCLAINGDVWRTIGSFDAKAFGKGYGEENDWCQRAMASGYRNVLVPNIFVFHNHGGSFPSDEKKALIDTNIKIIDQRWPNYLSSVHSHIARDPWRGLREDAIIALCLANHPTIIFDHSLGGGANSYRHKLVRKKIGVGLPTIVVSYSMANRNFEATYHLGDAKCTVSSPALEPLLDSDKLKIGANLIYNNAVSWPAPLEFVTILSALSNRDDINLKVLIHDYYSLCPSYTLLNDEGRYCGVPSDLSDCQHCLQNNPHAAVQQINIAEWRACWGALLATANEIVCFSEASRKIVERAYPSLASQITVLPHEPVTIALRKPDLRASKNLIVGIIGGINFAKGARVVLELCAYLMKVDPAARVVVIGEFDPTERRPAPNLTVHGRYDAAELPDLIEGYGINICLLPSIWPETFSYVTQEIMDMELPLICFDLGAPAERVKLYANGSVVPLSNSATLHGAITALQGRTSRKQIDE